MGELIQYRGISELKDDLKDIVERLSAEYHDKIRRSLHDDTSLIVHLKVHKQKKDNKGRVKYSLHCKAVSPTGIFDSTRAHDWELPKVLHMGFHDLLAQIEHTLHMKKHPKQGRKKSSKVIM